LNKAEDEISNEAPKRGELLNKQAMIEPKDSRRKKKVKKRSTETEGVKTKLRCGYTWTENKRVRDLPVCSGDDVRIKTARFGKGYAKNKPEFTYGKVIDVMKNDKAKVMWKQGDVDTVTRLSLKIKTDSATSIPIVCDNGKRSDRDDKIHEFGKSKRDLLSFPTEWTASTILPIMEVGRAITTSEIGGTHPRDFYEALVRPDWREWVQAVKDEMESWTAFQACEEVNYRDIEKGASVIP
jgi:hypothetical protein